MRGGPEPARVTLLRTLVCSRARPEADPRSPKETTLLVRKNEFAGCESGPRASCISRATASVLHRKVAIAQTTRPLTCCGPSVSPRWSPRRPTASQNKWTEIDVAEAHSRLPSPGVASRRRVEPRPRLRSSMSVSKTHQRRLRPSVSFKGEATNDTRHPRGDAG